MVLYLKEVYIAREAVVAALNSTASTGLNAASVSRAANILSKIINQVRIPNSHPTRLLSIFATHSSRVSDPPMTAAGFKERECRRGKTV